jgi:transposase
MGWYDRKLRRVRDLSCGDTRIFLELELRRLDCRHCGKVKRERFDFLADNPLYTKRFAYYVGRRCRSATIKDVAAELKLDLAHGRGAGPAVYGSAARACRHAFTAGDWH